MGLFDDLLGDSGSQQTNATPAVATTFGYNDPEDNGVGAWGDKTNRPDVAGVSLPVPVLRQQFGDPNKAHGQLVKVTNPDTGQSVVAPIIDKGPADWVVGRQGNTIDLTHATNLAIGGSGKTPVKYEFVNQPKTQTQGAGLFDDLLSQTNQQTQAPVQQQQQTPQSGGLFDDLLASNPQQAQPSASPSPTPEQTGKVINLPAYNPIENALRNFANTAATSTINSIGGAVRYFGGAQQKDLKMAQDELAQAKSSGASEDNLSEIQGRIDKIQSQLGSTKEASSFLSDLSSQYPAAYGVNPEDKSVSAQIGRGLGGVTAMLPIMSTGPAGMALGGLQGASTAYEDAYQQSVQNLKNQGMTDQSSIDDQAQKEASIAAVKTLPQLGVYMVGGKLASEGVSKLLSTQTPLIQGVAGAVAGSIANTAAGATIRKFMGENVMPTAESLTQDIAFGLFHGVGTGVEAQEKLRQQQQAKAKLDAQAGGPAPQVAPSANPVVNEREAKINAMANEQAVIPEAPKPVETAPVAPEKPETPVGKVPVYKPITIYHGTTEDAAKAIEQNGFDISKSSDGTFWFTTNKDKIENGEVAASGKGSIIQRAVDEGKLKLGGWDEHDKYSNDQLIAMGYDGIKLPDEGETTYQIFHPEKLTNIITQGKPAEAPAEAQPTTENAVQEPSAREVGVRNAPAVGEGVGEENKSEVPTEEGQAPKEVAPIGRKPVGISKASIADQRLDRMAQQLPKSERQPNIDKINDALEINNESRIPVESLVSDILEKGDTAKTPEDVALLTVELNRLQLEREKVQSEFDKIQDPRPSDYAILNNEIKPIDEKINRLDKAIDAVGTSAGRLLQMFKIMLAEDFSPVALQRKTIRDLRRPLTEDEKQTIEKQAEEHKALMEERDKTRENEQLKAENEAVKSRLKEALKEIESRKEKEKKTPKETYTKKAKTETPLDQKIVDKLNALAEKVRQERKGKLYAKISPVDVGDVIIGASHIANGLKSFKDWSVKMASEIKGATKDYLRKVWGAANEKLNSYKEARTPDDICARIKAEAIAGEELSHKSVDDLVKAHLEDGLRGESEVMKAVHDDIKKAYPNATERDVRRAFSEYGKEAKVNPDELLKRKRELRTLVRLQESIDRIKEGFPALKTNARREKAIQEIREKQATLNELLKTVKSPPSDEQLATAYSKKKTALENAIEDLDKQLRTGERPKPKTRTEEPVDIEQLRSELDAMRRKREEIDKEEAPKFSPQEKENERLRKLYDKQIADLDARLKGIEKPKPEKTSFEKSLENEQKMAERDAMRQKLKEIEKEEADRKKPSPEQKEIDRIQRAIDDVNDRIHKGEKIAPTPKKEPLTEYARKLQEDLKKAKEQFKRVTGKEPESKEDRYNRKRIETIEKMIAEMEDKMRRGDYSKPTRKEPPIKYPATELAETKLKDKEREINAWREKKEKAERPSWERKLRFTSETARELTIAGINVLKKIGGYMQARALATTAEEVIGYTGKHLMGFGGVKGELESGASLLKTLPAQARGYLKGAKQFLRTLKSGESDSSLLYDKSHVEQRSNNWARWIGSNLHAALKNISSTGKEEVYKEHLYANAIADGLIDPSNPFDPKNQMAIAGLNLKAYLASKAEKLSEDNIIATKIAEAHKWAESPNKQGELNSSAVVASHAIKALITKGIYKIGINYPTQTLKYAITKPIEAVARTLNAYWKGIDNITPKEMDLISSAYKVGGLGAAMVIWGALDALRDEKDRVFGGYYQQGRKQGDAKWGTMRILGKNWHIHMPAIEAAQFSNTMMRTFLKHKDKTDMGMAATIAFAESLGGLASSAPITGPITEVAKSPTSYAKYFWLGQIPSAVRDVAKMTDTDAQGETIPRYPKTIKENYMVGIPGLRKEITSTKPTSSRSSSPRPVLGGSSSGGSSGSKKLFH